MRLLVDSSVVIKWFHAEGESELDESRAIRGAHLSGELEAMVIDLAVYEVGNVLARALRWPASDIAQQLEDLLAVLGRPLVMAPAWLRDAAELAETHGLSFYDASWAAVAQALQVPLVSADRQLLSAGLAQSATQASARWGLI